MSWRRAGLQDAAARTGLRIQYPILPTILPAQVQDFIRERPGTGDGSAASWMNHLKILESAKQFESALILEDDADWDIDIHEQLVTVASAVKNLTQDASNSTEIPYGTDWDLLWLGHCGDSIPNDDSLTVQYADASIPIKINAWDGRLLSDPHRTRYVHVSSGPICTFAYAVKRATATKILEQQHGNSEGFDIWLHMACKTQLLKCITVNPELFHHHERKGALDSMINGPSRHEGAIGSDKTDNILHSARCNSKSKSLVTCMGDEAEEREVQSRELETQEHKLGEAEKQRVESRKAR